MILVLRRTKFTDNGTIGELWVGDNEDGKFFCHTLEDTVRAEGVKIPGKTAIPYGTYKVIIDYSNRFKRDMPHILDVNGFVGVRIHPGNTVENTEGCILVGKQYQNGMILTESRKTYDILFSVLLQARDEITLQIVDAREEEKDAFTFNPDGTRRYI